MADDLLKLEPGARYLVLADVSTVDELAGLTDRLMATAPESSFLVVPKDSLRATQTDSNIGLSPIDALRALAVTQYGGDSDLLDSEHDCADLYAAGVIQSHRDITDEYVCSLTHQGNEAIKALLACLTP